MQHLRFAHDTPPGRKKTVHILMYYVCFHFLSFSLSSNRSFFLLFLFIFISINPNLVEPFANWLRRARQVIAKHTDLYVWFYSIFLAISHNHAHAFLVLGAGENAGIQLTVIDFYDKNRRNWGESKRGRKLKRKTTRTTKRIGNCVWRQDRWRKSNRVYQK